MIMPEKQMHGSGQAGEPVAEKMRLIRFRMTNEHPRLRDEIRLIPRKLVIVVIALFVIAEAGVQVAVRLDPPTDWREFSPLVNSLFAGGIVLVVSVFISAILFLIGYVHEDARRRGMNATLWTLLVIILLPAYLGIGFIIYFLLREPLPYPCPQCGEKVSARFNYCPNCKFNLRPACPQCEKEVHPGDRFCANCAAELSVGGGTTPGGVPPFGDLGTAT